MLTNLQLGKLHQYRQRIDRLTGGVCDRAWFDLVLRNVGDVRPRNGATPSSKQLNADGFERVMSFLEGEIADLDPSIGDYWRVRDARQGNYLSSRQQWQITCLHAAFAESDGRYPLAALVARVSHGRATELKQLSPAEAHNLIEMLKAASARQKVGT